MKYRFFYIVCFFASGSFFLGASETGDFGKDFCAINGEFSHVVLKEEDSNATICELGSMKSSATLEYSKKDSFENVSFSKDNMLVGTLLNKNLSIWDTSSGYQVCCINLGTDLTSFAFVKNGLDNGVFVGTKRGVIYSIDSITKFGSSIIKKNEDGPIDSIVLNNAGTKIAAISKGTKKVYVFDVTGLKKGEVTSRVVSLDYPPSGIAFVENDESLILASDNGVVSLNISSPQDHLNYSKSIEYFHNKHSFFSKLFFPCRDRIKALQGSPDCGKKFLVGFNNGLVTVNDSKTGDTLTSFSPYSFLHSATFNKDGSRFFVTAGQSYSIKDSPLEDVELVRNFKSPRLQLWCTKRELLGSALVAAGMYVAITDGGQSLLGAIRAACTSDEPLS